jgi:superfamily II DNA or RNA helicase
VRAAVATAKLPTALEVVTRWEEEREPQVVFCCHRAPVDTIGAREGWSTITGDVPSDERTRRIDSFQRGELKGLALTVQAGGTGITLTRAARVLRPYAGRRYALR